MTTGRVLVAALLPLCLACATVGTMRSQPLDAGVYRAYRAPLPEVVAAARQAMVGSGMQIQEAPQIDDRTWMIIAKKGASLGSYGELVRTVVHEQEDVQIGVRVVTKKKMATNTFARDDWSQPIFDQIALQLQTRR